MPPLTFVVGTGRCGSTFLSRILHEHPEVLSLNEFFTTIRRRAFPPDPLDGAGFWRLTTDPRPILDGFVRNGLRLPEQIYPYGPGRFDPAHGVPAICHMTLPLLTADPDALFDELAAEIPDWPRRPVAGHYRALFDLLADRLGRRVVVERSGMSLPLVAPLRRAFPEARFVHLHRDGPDCAVSMSGHPGFRLAMLLNGAARAIGLDSLDQLTDEHARLLPVPMARLLTGRYDAGSVMDADIPLTAFGRMWSSLVVGGLTELSRLPAHMWTTIGYRSLITDPEPQLARLAGFVGVEPDRRWLRESADRVDASRAGAAAHLDPATLADLRAACAPGTHALASLTALPR